jgi:hypothetical protein
VRFAVAETQSFAEAIGPYLPILGVLLGGIVVGGFAIYNRKRGAVETKMPSVAESWAESRVLRAERDAVDGKLSNLRQAFDALLALFRGYVQRVQRGGPPRLTSAEQAALDLPVGTDEDWPTITPQQLDELRP